MMLYHLTNHNNIKSIMEHGLLPRCGNNSLLVNDYAEQICLSTLNDIPYWHLNLLDADVLLKVNCPDGINILKTSYDIYDEYAVYDPIPPKFIEIEPNIPESKSFHVKQIAKENLYFMTYLVHDIFDKYDCIDGFNENQLEREITSAIKMFDKIKPADALTLKEMFTEQEKYDFTISDKLTLEDWDFKISGPVWELLIQYPDDKFTELRTKLYECITEYYPYEYLHNIQTERIGA